MDCISGWCKSMRRLDGLTAIVTGCNTGIGKETVSDFYDRGAKVIMACRNMTKANIAKDEIEKAAEDPKNCGTLVVEELDTSSLTSVRQCAERMLASEDKIDILVNNAGVMMLLEGKTEDGFETQMATNHFGHALLTLLLMPKLMKSEAARIVMVSSYAHTIYRIDLEDMNFEKTEYSPLKAYCRSKAANILFAKALAVELKKRDISNVTTYSLHPGIINTDIGRYLNDTVGSTAAWVHCGIRKLLRSAKSGAQTTIYCSVDEACAKESGLYYSDCEVTSTSRQCRNNELIANFWEWTIKSLKLENQDLFPALA